MALATGCPGTKRRATERFGRPGDDYLVKPCALSEPLARLEALTRRPAPAPGQVRMRFVDLELDVVSREIVRGGRRIDLTPREFHILEDFLRHARQVVTRSMLAIRAETPADRQPFHIYEDPTGEVIAANLPRWPRSSADPWLRFELEEFEWDGG